MKPLLIAMIAALLATMGVPTSTKLPPSHPTMVAAEGCIDDVVAVATEVCPDPERLTCAKLAFVIAEQESGCLANPKCKAGPDCNDDGKACGPMQVHEPQKIIAGATCDKVRADRRLGLKVGLTHLRALGRKCNTIGLALSAYATRGECLKVDWQRSLSRCKLAGLDCTSPWTPGA